MLDVPSGQVPDLRVTLVVRRVQAARGVRGQRQAALQAPAAQGVPQPLLRHHALRACGPTSWCSHHFYSLWVRLQAAI